MTPRDRDRLARLEAGVSPEATGKHLVFKVEAPNGMPHGTIVTFLKERGHAIHEGDDVFLMNLGAHHMDEGEAPRDLMPALVTEEMRAAAPPSGRWVGSRSFTFVLDGPRDRPWLN